MTAAGMRGCRRSAWIVETSLPLWRFFISRPAAYSDADGDRAHDNDVAAVGTMAYSLLICMVVMTSGLRMAGFCI